MRAFVDAVRHLGVLDAGLMVLARGLEWLSAGRARLLKYYFMAQRVPPAPARPARSGGITVEELFTGDPRLAVLERPADEVARRFASASRCFAAWNGEELAGFLWFTERRYVEDEARCTFRLHPSDGAVWDYDVHIVPRFRLGRTFALLWEHAFRAMREQGARWSISRVSAFKPDSLRAHQRLGAQRTGWGVFLLFGSIHVALTSDGKMKRRRLEHGPYPEIDVRAPADAEGTPAGDLQGQGLPGDVVPGSRIAGGSR